MEIRRIAARKLTPEAFLPYGEVLRPPAERGRAYFEDALANGRPQAHASLSMSRVMPLAAPPLRATMLERHEFSSQSFVPLAVARWLVVVAPPAADGGPDDERAEAFVCGPGEGVTYRMGTWHHGLTVLDQPAQFAVFMWRDGTKGDEQFVDLARPFDVVVS